MSVRLLAISWAPATAANTWRKWADNVHGQAMRGGRFFPEENPTETAELLIKFLLA
jgi:haloacetate dehalogenase